MDQAILDQTTVFRRLVTSYLASTWLSINEKFSIKVTSKLSAEYGTQSFGPGEVIAQAERNVYRLQGMIITHPVWSINGAVSYSLTPAGLSLRQKIYQV